MGAQYPKSIPAADDVFTSRLTCIIHKHTLRLSCCKVPCCHTNYSWEPQRSV